MPFTLLTGLTSLAVAMGVTALLSLLSDLFSRDRTLVQDRLDVEFHKKQREKVKRSLLFRDNDPFQVEPDGGARTPRQSWREWLRVMLDQSGLDLTETRLLTYCGIAAMLSGLSVGLLMRHLLFGVLAAALSAFGPIVYVRIKRHQRLEALRKQLSDAFDLMARILRAGQSMTQAMQAVSTECASPIAEEFGYCAEQQNLGLAAEVSMRDLAKRTGIIEMNIFVVAVLVQRQVGGNLAEILEKLAGVVRGRFKTRGLIQTLTAEGRMQAMILMALPPLLLIAMLIVNHNYAMVLVNQPVLLGGMLLCMAIGGLWIRKIVNFDF